MEIRTQVAWADHQQIGDTFGIVVVARADYSPTMGDLARSRQGDPDQANVGGCQATPHII